MGKAKFSALKQIGHVIVEQCSWRKVVTDQMIYLEYDNFMSSHPDIRLSYSLDRMNPYIKLDS